MDTYTKGMGDGGRIRQRSQFTQLQRKAGLTDPISTNERQRRVACCNATFSKSNGASMHHPRPLPLITDMNTSYESNGDDFLGSAS